MSRPQSLLKMTHTMCPRMEQKLKVLFYKVSLAIPLFRDERNHPFSQVLSKLVSTFGGTLYHLPIATLSLVIAMRLPGLK